VNAFAGFSGKKVWLLVFYIIPNIYKKGPAMNLIPQPKSINQATGSFTLSNETLIVLVNNQHLFQAQTLQKNIFAAIGTSLPITASLVALPHCINLTCDNDASSEEYAIIIGTDRVDISALSPKGLFYAVQTLSQIVVLYKKSLPCCTISDTPDFVHRGFYHDVTRGKVPTLATLKLLADTCARYKINQLQLYIEHTFAFRAIPEVWADKDPITAEEILELDAYCRERYIELVPSMSTFGHLYELIRHPKYEHLNELDIKASQVPFDLYDRMSHYTLDVSQNESFALVKSMV
jgi:N-acetyl-beta-hexosaminidase